MNRKIFVVLLAALGFTVAFGAVVPLGYCALDFDFTEIMDLFSEMLPLIIYMTMIGAVMGLIAGVTKKMGKW